MFLPSYAYKTIIEYMDAIVTAQTMIYKLSFSTKFVNNNPHITIWDILFCYGWHRGKLSHYVLGQVEPQHHHLFCTVKLSKSSFLITIPFFHLRRYTCNNYISIAYFQYRWAKLQIIWKQSVTVKNAFILHVLDQW